MQSNENSTIHCVKVPRVLDWVTKSTVMKLKEIVDIRKKKFDDLICCDFCVPCGDLDPTVLWTTYGVSQIGGSFYVKFKAGCGGALSVFVNGEKQADVSEGSSFSATFTHLDSIEVQCNEGNVRDGSCYGEFKVMLHFHLNDACKINSIKDIKKTICYVSDCHGNPITLDNGCVVTCEELTCPEDRANVHVNDERGDKILLQRVDVLKQGFISVQFVNHNGDICLTSVFPFSEVETVVLCAPYGTEVTCDITNVDCRAHVLPSLRNNTCCIEVVIILTTCQSIKSVDEVIIELKGTIRNPRED